MNEWLWAFKKAFILTLKKLQLDKAGGRALALIEKKHPFELFNFLEKLLFSLKEGKYLSVKFVSLIISLFFFILALVFFFKLNFLGSKLEDFIYFFKFKRSTSKPKSFLKDWKKIEGFLKKGASADLKLAIVEADKILEEALKNLGYQGENIKERLEQISKEVYPNLEDLKYAHKIRNRIVHEKNFSLSKAKAEAVLRIYEDFLRNFHFKI